MPNLIQVHVPPSAPKELTRSIRIWNLAMRPVHLTVQPMCGCTRTSWSEKEIGPLSAAPLDLHFDSHAFREDRNVDVTFKTNWASQPFASIHVQSSL